MGSESRDLELWLEGSMQRWAEQGQLPRGKSIQLDKMVARMAQQEKRRRLMRAAFSFVAAFIVCIWLLFTNCPVAAANYFSGPTPASPFDLSILPVLISLAVPFIVWEKSAGHKINDEVRYE
ncbi:MAG: hypothetical protein H6Q64_1155 [Firmicutes bacterium]|nr:hypothetical protein [Bacillota bacterium]